MPKTRILIVDDSTVMRRLLSAALTEDPTIEVAGTAANGRIALQKIAQVNPDLVTLDIEMPEMDGLATLVELRKQHPRLPVIMFSTLTQRGAVATITALSQGASDYVTKPTNEGGITAAMQTVRAELIPRIKALCRTDATGGSRTSGVAKMATTGRLQSAAGRLQRFDCLAIGVSTGGPNALTEVFRELPADLAVPIVIVQHMPPVFTHYLAERLNAVSGLEVREAQGGEPLLPGSAWLARGNFHLALARAPDGVHLKLHQELPENSCRPAVDVLFRSVAEIYGPAALGVVLTGMGQDGLRGSQALAAAGGRLIVQDEATSVVWGMPGAVAGAGLADAILPLPQIAREIVRLANQRRVRPLAKLPVAAHA